MVQFRWNLLHSRIETIKGVFAYGWPRWKWWQLQFVRLKTLKDLLKKSAETIYAGYLSLPRSRL